MITFYNETENPMNLINVKSKNILLFQKYLDKNVTYKPETYIQTVISKYLFDNDTTGLEQSLIDKLTSLVNMRKPEVVMDKNCSIIFSREDFNPIVVNKPSEKAIAILSLDIRNKILVRSSRTSVFVLDYTMDEKELNMFVSINENEHPLKLQFYDKTTRLYTNYVFTNVCGKIELSKEFEPADIETDKLPTINISKFRPSKCTYHVIGLSDSLPERINPGAVNYMQIDNLSNLDKVYSMLLEQKAKALTIYTDKIPQAFIKMVIEYFEPKMKVLYILDKSTKINKVKF